MDLHNMEKALKGGYTLTYTDLQDFNTCTALYVGGNIVLVKRASKFLEEEYHHLEALLITIQDYQVTIK